MPPGPAVDHGSPRMVASGGPVRKRPGAYVEVDTAPHRPVALGYERSRPASRAPSARAVSDLAACAAPRPGRYAA